jgi:flagellar basal-body rod protein FlgG
MRALFTAAAGMQTQQMRMDNIANNLANVNTQGFKKSRAEFEDLYYQKIRTGGGTTQAGTGRNDTVEIGHGARVVAMAKDLRQGAILETGNMLDVAIRGDGFFAVESPDGTELYTRTGAFHTDSEGNVLTVHGYRVLPGLVVPLGAQVTVAQDGVVSAQVPGQDPQEIGQLQLRRFQNPQGLEALGSGLFRRTAVSGEPAVGTPGQEGFGDLLGGALESSNVDVAEELIAMIMAQRSYEANTKVIQTSDEMLQLTSQLK